MYWRGSLKNISSAPIFKSLLLPHTFLGMPKPIFYFLVFITLANVVILVQYWFLVVSGILTVMFIFMTKRDPFFFDIYLELIKFPEVMD
jgi:type IV secretory pathway VirB3-like protein